MEITTSTLHKWGSGWSDLRLRDLFGDKPLTPIQVLNRDDLSHADRMWILLRPEVLGNRFAQVVNQIADRSVSTYAMTSDIESVSIWGEAWMSGADRTAESANAVAAALYDPSDRLNPPRAAAIAAARSVYACAAPLTHHGQSEALMSAGWAMTAAAWNAGANAARAEERRQLADIRAALEAA